MSGIYIADKYKSIITYDIRICQPNKWSMPIEAAHTLEHLFAIYLRTLSPIKDKIVAVNGMFCLTGFYLLIDGIEDTEYLRSVFLDMLKWIQTLDRIPIEPNEYNCGTYKSHNLSGAKVIAMSYYKALSENFQDKYQFLN